MTSEHYERGLDILRDSEADEDFRTEETVKSPYATSGEASPSHAAATDAVGDLTAQAIAKAGDVTAQAASKAGDLAESAAGKAAELKDLAIDRGGDVAGVARDELARLAQEARSEVQSLWSEASGQLRVQASAGQKQLSELLHSLSGELGEMASKSESGGPLTALAKQAAAKGGEWSHWLANSEPRDVLTQVRRFARQRPFVFLASAAVAGVVVGRLSRGLMAATDAGHTDAGHSPTHAAEGSTGSVSVTAGVTTPPPVSFEEVPSFGSGEPPEQLDAYAPQASADNPYGVTGVNGGAR